jgi:hypothetical protein
MWAGLTLPQDDTESNLQRFRGLVRRPDYMTHLEKRMENPSVFIELTSVCNFFCSYCYSSKSIRPKGFMKEELFYRIADQLQEFADGAVAFYVDGEPTLHPKFYSFVKYLNTKKIPVHVASNASNLKPEFLDLQIKIVSYISSSKAKLAQRSKIEFEQYLSRIVDYIGKWRLTILYMYCLLYIRPREGPSAPTWVIGVAFHFPVTTMSGTMSVPM